MARSPFSEQAGLSAAGLGCRRGARLLFDRLDLDLKPGAALIVRGPNGSGKSSLLRQLAGFLSPDQGEVRWNGGSIRGDLTAHRTRVHYVGHLDGLKPQLSVQENLAGWAELMGNPMPVRDALVHFGLTHLADLPVRVLSAGQKRRTALARLGCAARPLWLLDEPTTALDLEGTEKLESLIAEHRRAGGIVVLATHIGVRLEMADELMLDDVFRPADEGLYGGEAEA